MMTDFDRFEVLVSRWAGAYVRAVHSYVGVKTPEGPRLLCATVLFEMTRSPLQETPFEFETEHIVAGRFVTAAAPDQVSASIAKSKVGRMVGPSDAISLAPDQSGQFSPYLSQNSQPLIWTLFIRGDSRHNLLNKTGISSQFDGELRAADVPFDSLDDLLEHCG